MMQGVEQRASRASGGSREICLSECTRELRVHCIS